MRQYRPVVGGVTRNDPNYVTRTKTDHLARHTREIAQELMLRGAQMTDNALSVDTRWFYYYKRKTVGRRCSCVAGEQSTASGTCGCCYGTGIVGGYDKYGTHTELVDSTYPKLDMINVTTRPEPRPSSLVLEQGATTGVVKARIKMRRNAGYVDNMHVHSTAGVTVEIKASNSAVWVPATSIALTTMLDAEHVDVKVTLHRSSVRDESPVFLKLFVRYGLLPKTEIELPGDIPKNTESVSLQEYGFDEQFGTVNVVMGSAGHGRTSKITTFSNEDFLYYIERARHWKITEVSPTYALGVYASFDITARWVQSFEAYRKFPV